MPSRALIRQAALAALVAFLSLSLAPRVSAVPLQGVELGTQFSPPVSEPVLAEALQLLNSGQLDAAIGKARGFIKENPVSAPAHEVLGAALAFKGEIDEALKALRRSIELDPKQHTAITKIGDILLAQGKLAEAKQEFLKAVQIAPDNSRAHQRLGLLYEREGRHDL